MSQLKNIAIINGPNLNLLGQREPEIYGSRGFESFLEMLEQKYPQVVFSYFQSNVEGELVNALQRFGFEVDGIILNPGGYTHTSVAIGDAIAAIKSPVIEVHISNVQAREDFGVLFLTFAEAQARIDDDTGAVYARAGDAVYGGLALVHHGAHHVHQGRQLGPGFRCAAHVVENQAGVAVSNYFCQLRIVSESGGIVDDLGA